MNSRKTENSREYYYKPKYFKIFDGDTKRIVEEKSKVLRWVVEKMPFLRDIESLRTGVFNCRKDTLRLYKITLHQNWDRSWIQKI